MNILVVGGAGYIGSHAVRFLLAAGHQVTVYDNLSRGHREAVPDRLLVEGELTDRSKLVSLLRERQIDAVMHFASYINVGESVQEPDKYYKNNLVNTLYLLDAQRPLAKLMVLSAFPGHGALLIVQRDPPRRIEIPEANRLQSICAVVVRKSLLHHQFCPPIRINGAFWV